MTLFSKELAIGYEEYCRADRWMPDWAAGRACGRWSGGRAVSSMGAEVALSVAMALRFLGQHHDAAGGREKRVLSIEERARIVLWTATPR